MAFEVPQNPQTEAPPRSRKQITADAIDKAESFRRKGLTLISDIESAIKGLIDGQAENEVNYVLNTFREELNGLSLADAVKAATPSKPKSEKDLGTLKTELAEAKKAGKPRVINRLMRQIKELEAA